MDSGSTKIPELHSLVPGYRPEAWLPAKVDINRLQPKDRDLVLTFLDAFLTKTKLRGIM